MSETKDTELLVEHTYNGKQLKIYPEVAEFFAKKKDADRLYYLGNAKADAQYNTLRDAAYVAYLEGGGDQHEWYERRALADAIEAKRTARQENENRYYDAIEAQRIDPTRRSKRENVNLWEELRDKTSHKVVKWMLEHTLRQQPSETETMLHYLPNNPETLWSYAKDDHEFCTVFDQFFSQAEASGLFRDTDMGSMVGFKEFRALQSYLRRELYGSTATEVGRRVSRIMTIIQEDAAKRVDEAKAEWQGLDEAWRSERSRRGAATRAANQAATEELDEAPASEGPAPVPEVQVPTPSDRKDADAASVPEAADIRAAFTVLREGVNA